MKNKRTIYLLMMLLMFSLVGCKEDNSKTHDTSIEQDDEKIVEMTDEEEAILCSVYVNEDRIKEGKLYDYQYEALVQFRYAKEYLQKKYPGFEFSFYAFYPEDKTNTTTTLEFTVDDTDNYFTVEVHSGEEGYTGKDNLYGYILASDYEAMVVELLGNAGIDNCMVYASMDGTFGEEIDGNTSVDEIVEMGKDIKIDLQIFVDMEGGDDAATKEIIETIEEQIRDINNYGGHLVYFAPGISTECESGEDCIEYRKEHDLYCESFNTFD